jgi:hypothetical protein
LLVALAIELKRRDPNDVVELFHKLQELGRMLPILFGITGHYSPFKARRQRARIEGCKVSGRDREMQQGQTVKRSSLIPSSLNLYGARRQATRVGL